MSFVMGNHAAVIQLCEAIGLDAKKVKAFRLTAGIDEITTIEVEYFVDEREIKPEKIASKFYLCVEDE